MGALSNRVEADKDATIKEAEFPYPYREGQRELVTSVYRTILRKKKLFIQAPTGVGKTMTTIFPAVKAVGEGLGIRFLPDGEDDYKNCGRAGISDSKKERSAV